METPLIEFVFKECIEKIRKQNVAKFGDGENEINVIGEDEGNVTGE